MQTKVYATQKLIQQIIPKYFDPYEDNLIQEFTTLCKSSGLHLGDNLNVADLPPIIQKFFGLLTQGVSKNFNLSQNITIENFKIQNQGERNYLFLNEGTSTEEFMFATDLDGFGTDFKRISTKNLCDNAILGVSEGNFSTKALEDLATVAHNSSSLFIYDRYMFREFGATRSRIVSLESTILPMICAFIKDLSKLDKIEFLAFDTNLGKNASPTTLKDLEFISSCVSKSLCSRNGFTGVVKITIANEASADFEHGRWMISDYLKIKSDDSFNYANTRKRGLGADLFVYPLYKSQHGDQAAELIELFRTVAGKETSISYSMPFK